MPDKPSTNAPFVLSSRNDAVLTLGQVSESVEVLKQLQSDLALFLAARRLNLKAQNERREWNGNESFNVPFKN